MIVDIDDSVWVDTAEIAAVYFGQHPYSLGRWKPSVEVSTLRLILKSGQEVVFTSDEHNKVDHHYRIILKHWREGSRRGSE